VEHFLPGAMTTENIGRFIEENMGASPVYPSVVEEEDDDIMIGEDDDIDFNDNGNPFTFEDGMWVTLY
jgi:hypothetical protein